ncbi:MAG: hypothetical protein CMJ46_13650 [Planctomyces sp.]|nr:hypothetical protein [Planctomyces sp.]
MLLLLSILMRVNHMRHMEAHFAGILKARWPRVWQIPAAFSGGRSPFAGEQSEAPDRQDLSDGRSPLGRVHERRIAFVVVDHVEAPNERPQQPTPRVQSAVWQMKKELRLYC